MNAPSPNRSVALWVKAHPQLVGVAAAGGVMFVLVYGIAGYAATQIDDGVAQLVASLARDVAPGAIVVLGGYLAVSYALWVKGVGDPRTLQDDLVRSVTVAVSEAEDRQRSTSCIKTVGFDFDDISLDRLASKSSDSIVVMARFWDSAFRQPVMEEFLRGGGRVDVVTVHPARDGMLAIATDQRKHSGTAVELYPAETRLLASLRWLVNCLEGAGVGSDAVRIHTLECLPNYAAYAFDGGDLVLVPYEHSFREAARCPRFHLDLTDQRVTAFWDNEVRRLVRDDAHDVAGLIALMTDRAD